MKTQLPAHSVNHITILMPTLQKFCSHHWLGVTETICSLKKQFDFIFKKSYRSLNKSSIILFLMQVYQFFKRKGNEGRREQQGRPGEGHCHVTLNSSMLYWFLTCSVYQQPKTGTHTGQLTSSNETEFIGLDFVYWDAWMTQWLKESTNNPVTWGISSVSCGHLKYW